MERKPRFVYYFSLILFQKKSACVCVRLFYNRSGIKYRRINKKKGKQKNTLKEVVTEATDG
jgi:hypothetical protein